MLALSVAFAGKMGIFHGNRPSYLLDQASKYDDCVRMAFFQP